MKCLSSWYEALRGGSNLQRLEWGLAHTTKESRITPNGDNAIELGLLQLVCARSADMGNKSLISGAEGLEIPASFAQAQGAVYRSADLVRVRVILPVILPPAYFA